MWVAQTAYSRESSAASSSERQPQYMNVMIISWRPPPQGAPARQHYVPPGLVAPPGLRRLPRGPPRSNDIRLIDWPNCEDLRRSRRDAVPKGTHGGVKTRRRSRRQGSKQWTIATRHTHGQGLTAQGGTSSGRPRYQTRVQSQGSNARPIFIDARSLHVFTRRAIQYAKRTALTRSTLYTLGTHSKA